MGNRIAIFFLFVISLTGCGTDSPAQVEAKLLPPKHEFRAVWITTAFNLDWPSEGCTQPEAQRKEFITLLDTLQAKGINAVIVQVRVAGDAFYPSEYAPWSQWLTGKQGRAPSPYYDPLAFMIKECHERDMEFHAWFNPFRVVSHVNLSNVCADHISKKRPDWCFDYGVTRYFNPGIPMVREHITQVVMEVVEKYDIDGVHFDDYFYPYPETGMEVPDWDTYLTYKNGEGNLANWRRENVNRLIQQIHERIEAKKPRVKFGISPFFLWRNQYNDPKGTKTNTWMSSYDDQYADTKKWVEEGWVDYIAPQIYRNTKNTESRYPTILNWWAEQEFDRHLYIGHAMTKVNNPEDSLPWRPEEIKFQCELDRVCPKVSGDIYFRAETFMRNPEGLADTLKNRFYYLPCLIPPMTWKDSIPPLRPQRLNVYRQTKGFFISWEAPPPAEDGDSAVKYVLYKFPVHEPIDMSRADRIVTIQKELQYYDPEVYPGGIYWYYVTSVDRMHNESQRVVKKKVTF